MRLGLQRARDLCAKFPSQRVLVVGDLMLDRYLYGTVQRVSPEAPVPIVQVTREQRMPGGAGNVAWNLRALGARAALAGTLGGDEAGRDLRELLRGRGVALDGVHVTPDVSTTVKLRVIAERQQVVRVDWDGRLEPAGDWLATFCKQLATEVAASTAVIVEDYVKGIVCQPVLDVVFESAQRAGIPVGLDPKNEHELQMRGLAVATPNRKEAFAAAGLRERPALADPLHDVALLEAGERLRAKWDPDLLLITLGPQGMLLFPRGAASQHVPTRAREVFDVSGAGDTVIATCVLALAAGAEPTEAAELANLAAGVVVGKLGTATCSQDELLRHLEQGL